MAVLRLSTTYKKMWANSFGTITTSGNINMGDWCFHNQGGTLGSPTTVIIYSGTINDVGNSTVLLTQGTSSSRVEQDGNDCIIVYGCPSTAATASGTASWFALGDWAYGTIGTDSGSDLVIGTLSITSGQEYTIDNIKFNFTNAI